MMNFLSCMLLTMLLLGSMVYSNTHGNIRRSQSMAIKKIIQGPSEMGIAAEPLSIVKKWSTFNGKTLEKSLVLARRKRQAFHDMSGDPSLMFFHHLSEHGMFNPDTDSCDEVLSRPCKRLSDCHGCLGLFTCKMPQGRCDFKSVSKRTGIFYQSLQKNEASDVNAH